jgi:hypothetical protein
MELQPGNVIGQRNELHVSKYYCIPVSSWILNFLLQQYLHNLKIPCLYTGLHGHSELSSANAWSQTPELTCQEQARQLLAPSSTTA